MILALTHIAFIIDQNVFKHRCQTKRFAQNVVRSEHITITLNFYQAHIITRNSVLSHSLSLFRFLLSYSYVHRCRYKSKIYLHIYSTLTISSSCYNTHTQKNKQCRQTNAIKLEVTLYVVYLHLPKRSNDTLIAFQSLIVPVK